MSNFTMMGLDVSSATIGLSILSYSDKRKKKLQLKHAEYYKPNKKVCIFEMLSDVRKYIFEKVDEFKPSLVILEDIVMFMKGKSTAKTIVMLSAINRTVGTAVYDSTGQPPVLLGVIKVRHAIKPDKKMTSKEDVPKVVAKILKTRFPYIKDKDGKTARNRKGEVVVENYDMADAIALGCAYCKLFIDN
jgi:Holliday junction resolvasome RuvABC endonuclease subunit